MKNMVLMFSTLNNSARIMLLNFFIKLVSFRILFSAKKLDVLQ